VEEKIESNKWMIALSVMTGNLMFGISGSIVNVALPHMRGALGASVEEIAWVATGYILSSIIIMPIVALLSSRFGRKRFLLFSVVVFTCASMLCGIAWDLTSMVIFRIIQGVGGGTLIPVAQAILRETFPPREQARAMSIYGLGVMLGPALAPTLGGWIIDDYSWRWCFYINVPVGVINILLVTRFIEDPPYLAREKGKTDFAGLFFMAISLGTFQLFLEKGQREDWFSSNLIQYLAIISFVGFVLFIWRELTTDRPAVNLRILKDLNFSAGTLISGVLGMGLMSVLFILPLFMQQLLRYPAFDSGFALLPRGLAMLIAMPAAGRLYNKTGPRPLVGMGLFVCFISSYWLSRLSLAVGYWDIFTAQFLQGTGFGLIFVSLSTAALSKIEKPMMTAASGLYNVVRQVFGSIGIALSATLLSRGENMYRAMLAEHVTVSRNVTSDLIRVLTAYFSSRGVDQVGAEMKTLKVIEGIVVRQSTMLSFNHVFTLIAVLFLVAIPLVFLIKDERLKKF
jgi:DHA2 family multidrug resistance protein